jgi:hypothetical protein
MAGWFTRNARGMAGGGTLTDQRIASRDGPLNEYQNDTEPGIIAGILFAFCRRTFITGVADP